MRLFSMQNKKYDFKIFVTFSTDLYASIYGNYCIEYSVTQYELLKIIFIKFENINLHPEVE